jgi:HAD superfamily hydrolase (TIGR01509 family)
MNPLGVIFDMDGVLVDSYQAHFESWRRTARAHGTDMTPEQFDATFGRTNDAIIPLLWGDRVRPEDIPAWGDEKESTYRDILQADFPEMDGAHELLESLHAGGFRLAIGSSGPPENVALVRRSLPDVFSGAVTSMEVTHGKPDPEVFLKAAEALGLSPERCVVVEDAVPGVRAARNAGMRVIAMTGTAPRDRLDALADRVVDSLRELSPESFVALLDGAPETDSAPSA